MDRTRKLVQTARRRMVTGAMLHAAGRAMIWGGFAAVAAVSVSKLLILPVHWGVLVGSALGLSAVIGAIIGATRVRSELSAAASVDQNLRLKDTLSSAVGLSTHGPATEAMFVQLAQERAEQVSRATDPRRAAPIHLSRAWKIWPVLAAVSISAGLLVPQMDLLRPESRRLAERQEQERQRVLSGLEQAKAPAVPALTPDAPPVPSPVAEAQKRVLDDIHRELAEGKLSPSDAASKAASELAQAAESNELAAEKLRKETEAAQETLSRLGERSPASTGAQDQSALAQALRSGDLAKAAEAARQLLGQGPQSESERAQAAAELERIAQELREIEEQRSRESTRARQDKPEATSKTDTEDASQAASTPSTDAAEAAAAQQEPTDQTDGQPVAPLAEAVRRAAEQLREAPTSAPQSDTRQRPNQEAQESRSQNARETSSGDTKAAESKPDSRTAPESPSQSQPIGLEPKTPDVERTGQPDSKTPGEPTSAPRRPSDVSAQQKSESTSQSPQSASPQQAKPDPKASEQSAGSSRQAKPSPDQAAKDEPKDPAQSGQKPSDSASPSQNNERKPAGSQQSPTTAQGTAGDKSQSPTPSKEPGQAKQPTGQDPGRTDTTAQPSDNASGPKGERATPETKGQAADNKPSSQARPNADQQRPLAERPTFKSPQTESLTDRQSAPEQKQMPRPDQSAGKPDAAPQPGRDAKAASTPSQSEPASEKSGEAAKPSPGPDAKPLSSPQPTPSPTADAAQQPASDASDGQDKRAEPEGSKQDSPGAPSGDGLKNLAEKLQRLASNRKDAQQKQQAADDLRKRAEDLLRNATPEQRKQLERWAKDMQKSGALDNPPSDPPRADQRPPQSSGDGDGQDRMSAPSETAAGPGGPTGPRPDAMPQRSSPPDRPRTEIVDARSSGAGQGDAPPRVVAEWYGPGQRGQASDADLSRTVQEAVRTGERAIEEQAVPSRYDELLRRYFGKLADRAKAGAAPAAKPEQSAKPVQPAQDAP